VQPGFAGAAIGSVKTNTSNSEEVVHDGAEMFTFFAAILRLPAMTDSGFDTGRCCDAFYDAVGRIDRRREQRRLS